MSELLEEFTEYYEARSKCDEVYQMELERRAQVKTAALLVRILQQQAVIDSTVTRDQAEKQEYKHDLGRLSQENKKLESKIGVLVQELENYKRKQAEHGSVQKENTSLKTQINKLHNELNNNKNEINRLKQQFATQKAVLESKLENAKKNIRNLKDVKSPVKHVQPVIVSPEKPKPLSTQARLRAESKFSTSPFLAKMKLNTNNILNSTPISKNPILATSTPDGLSPLKGMGPKKASRPSGLSKMLSPNKDSKPAKKSSLFDDDEEEDKDDFFSAVKKVESTQSTQAKDQQPGEDPNQVIKKKPKRKIITKHIIDEKDDELKTTPVKKIKLFEKLGGISPLKQRNKERDLFKV